MEYIFLGGAGEVGASCMLLLVDKRHILIDCGVRVNESGSQSLPDLNLLKKEAPKLDAIFITHAHADHIGALPVVHKMYPNTPIYMTAATRSIGATMLNNAAGLMFGKEDAIYTLKDAEFIIQLGEKEKVHSLHVGRWMPLWNGWRLKLIYSGHILGAVSILMETPEGTFFYTGDVSLFHQKTIDGLEDVAGIEPDFMWCEATYGDSHHPSRATEERRLVQAVFEVIENSGTVLIPSFALGRAQEILLILQHAMESKVIPAFPVYVDGLIQSICSSYHNHSYALGTRLRNKLKNLPPKLREIFRTQHIGYVSSRQQQVVLEDNTPKCIIASSGMLIGGASVVYAKRVASHPKNAIFLSGYQDAESPGRRLQEMESGDLLTFGDETSVEVKCQVKRFHLSAHSDQGQLVSMIKQVNPKALSLVHGDPKALQALHDKLNKHYLVSIAKNSRIETVANTFLWLSPAEREQMQQKRKNVDLNVKVQDGTVYMDTDTTSSQEWQDFEAGEHTAIFKDNQLIIRKK